MTLDDLLNGCTAIENGCGRIEINCNFGKPRAVLTRFSGTLQPGTVVFREGRTPADALRRLLGGLVTDDFEGLL